MSIGTAPATTRHYRACNVCEAICGLAIDVRGGRVVRIEGDPDDPLSRGHVCPKAYALLDLQEDARRLRGPVRRVGDRFEPIGWNDALDLVAGRLLALRARDGAPAIAAYLGNPIVHSLGLMTHVRQVMGLLRTPNVFSATTVDQVAHHVAAQALYGHQMLVPVPDVDRTQHLLVLGANPLASNGSLMTAPGIGRRLKDLRRRGGRLVVIDPRRTETAAAADAHHYIRPGTDVYLLLGLLQVLFAEGRAEPGRLRPFLADWDALPPLVAAYTPESVAVATGMAPALIRGIAREFAQAPAAACYGRMGVSTQAYGGLCQWLVQLLNIATGNLDRAGGTLFPLPAVDLVGQKLSGAGSPGRARSRVSGRPSFGGEFPAALMAEEIETPGAGRIRGLLVVAGNPVSSTPNGRRLERALGDLEFMVALDYRVTATSRHAHVILPATTPLERDHYDFAFQAFAVRNVPRYSPPTLPRPAGALDDWEILAGLAARLADGLGQSRPKRRAPARYVNVALGLGPFGQRSRHPARLSLARLREHPHGLDLGPHGECLPERLRTADGRVQCAPPAFVADLARAHAALGTDDGGLRLIGRRHLLSNNSWLHGYARFTRGEGRTALLVHPRDLAARNLADGDRAVLASRAGGIEVQVRASDDVMPGAVCLPHGWGRDGAPGASYNDATDETALDPLTGAAILNGVPVELRPAAATGTA